MKIIFFGASKFVIPIIKMLNKHFELTLVITTERDESDVVPAFCKKNNIPYLSIKKASEAMQRLQEEKEALGVLAYFGLLLPKELLETFTHGIINIHPSLLPKYRGATPVQSALLSGETETGVTIIKLDEQMDHGPILAQEKETILPTDTTETLHARLFQKGTEMLEELIPLYGANKITLHPQNDTDATYTKRAFTRQDGFIDLDNLPETTELDRMIRAYYPWPTVWTLLRLSATDEHANEKRIKLLPGNKLQMEGKKPVSIKDFINGYPEMKEIIQKLL